MFETHLSLFLSFHVYSLFLKLIEEMGEQPGKNVKDKLIRLSKYAAEIVIQVPVAFSIKIVGILWVHFRRKCHCKSMQISSDHLFLMMKDFWSLQPW